MYSTLVNLISIGMVSIWRSLLAANKKIFISIILLATFAASIAFGTVPIRYPEPGLDPSWQQALVEATDAGRTFGDSIVFTYGPFHQAVTNQASENLSALLASRAIFALVWFGTTALIGFSIGLSSATAIAISAAVLGVWHAGPPGDAKFYLFSLIAITASHSIWSFRHERFSSWRKSALSVLLATGALLSTLVKLSFLGSAVPALLSIYGFQILSLIRSPGRKPILSFAVSIVVPILFLYLLWGIFVSWSPNTVISYYLGSNLDIITGYTDAMSKNVSWLSLILVSLYWMSIFMNLTFYGLLTAKEDCLKQKLTLYCRSQSILAAISLALLSWVCFKAAYVRDDSLHVVLAGMYTIALTVVIAGFRWRELRELLRNHDKATLILASLPLLCISFVIADLGGGYNNMAQGLFDSVSMITSSGREAIAMKRRKKLKDIQVDSENYMISPGSSADIMPWEITGLLANQLAYKPRPIPQSYSTYTDSLQKVNKDFFDSSPNRPDFVIIEAKDIDGRLPVGLDSAALAAIKENYSFSHKGNRGSLVFKLGNSNETDAIRSGKSNCELDDQALTWRPLGRLKWQSNNIIIPSNRAGFLTLTTHFKNSLSRSLLSSLYRPFPVTIEYLDAQQNVLGQYRFIPKAGKQIVAYPVILNNDDLFDFMTSSETAGAPQSQEIRYFRFTARNIGAPFKTSNYSLKFACL